ncbi:MAG: hypothetical protein ACYCQI_03170 [Gammaproteobacteria bacterium]
MMEQTSQKFKPMLPFKSVAGALLFSALLGPVGLLYSSVRGGVVMIILGFIVLSSQLFVPIALVWVGSTIWAVAATNKYNNKLLKLLSRD